MSDTAHVRIQVQARARIGTVLRRKYRIDRLLGIGGMAAVYAATHRHGHRVAVKVLHDARSGDERSLLREARLANTVDHPGVLNIQDDDVTEEGCLFLVMPLLQGETVQARWERYNHRLPLNEVVAIVDALLAVLAAAHDKQVIHRDIKPDNLFLTLARELKVLDFGIARSLGRDAEASVATRSGRAVGTPAFMSPEQAFGRSRDVNPRTDIWGVGATMFTLLSGRYVHEADTGGAMIIHAATQRARPLIEICPDLPTSVCDVVDRALAFEAEGRWTDAPSMRNALGRAFDALAGPEVAPRRSLSELEIPNALVAGRGDEPWRPSEPAEPVRAESLQSASLAAKVTRTSTETSSLVARTEAILVHQRDTARRSRNKFARWAIAGAACMAALAWAGTAWRQRVVAAPSSMPLAAAARQPSLDQPSRETNPLALSEFTTGIQQWKDASADEAREAFERAAIADTTLASAHLRYVMCSGRITPAVRAHYGKALNLRALLTNDERRVLDAFEPAMRDPADLATTTEQLSQLAGAWPDPLLVLTLAARRLRLSEPTEAIEAADRASSLAHTKLGLTFAIRAMAHTSLDDIDAARDDLQTCLSFAPHSSVCLEVLTTLEASEGNCYRVAELSRRWIAVLPDSYSPYRFLAGALLMTGGTVDSARDALEQGWSRLDSVSRPLAEARDQYSLRAWSGDFSAAASALDAWERMTSSVSDSHERGLAADSRLQLNLEIGHRTEAARFARLYLERNKAWAVSPQYDPRVSALHVLRETGSIGDTEFNQQSDSWRAAAGNSYGTPARIWYNFYAVPAGTAADGERALAELPKYGLFDRSMRSASCDLTIGNVYYVARRYPEAASYFKRAEQSCHFDDVVERVQASLQLGRSDEAVGNAAEACDAYKRVLARWPHSPDSVSAALARKRIGAMSCVSLSNAHASNDKMMSR